MSFDAQLRSFSELGSNPFVRSRRIVSTRRDVLPYRTLVSRTATTGLGATAPRRRPAVTDHLRNLFGRRFVVAQYRGAVQFLGNPRRIELGPTAPARSLFEDEPALELRALLLRRDDFDRDAAGDQIA
jgi:hypothetical protein